MAGQLPVCSKLYKSELEDTKHEISFLKRLRITVQVFGALVFTVGFIALFFPNLISADLQLDNLSKFVSIFLGGGFFSTINLFNKGDLMMLKKRKIDLEIFIEEYRNYEEKPKTHQQKLMDECNQILQKRKGL